MKKRIPAVCCMMLMLFVGSAMAKGDASQSPFKVDVGFQAYYHEYKEPGLMKNEGYFGGIAYRLAYEDTLLLEINGIATYGQVDYSSTSTGSTDDVDDLCTDTRLIIGAKIFDDVKTQVYPFVGFGYRYLQDDSEGRLTTTNNIGYLRESNYYYSPIGIRVRVNYPNGWSLTPELEYDYFWEGEQESGLGYITGNGDVTNEQDEGYGYRLSLTLAKKTQNFGFSCQIFYRYWDIDDSQVTYDAGNTGWIEPDNETVEYGFTISLLF